jgi:uncharacterized protein (TIGR03435 family)
MKKLMLCLGVLFAMLTLPAAAQDITGQWQGVIKTPNRDLRVIVKITKDDAKLQAMFYSIDQPQAPPFRATGTRFEGGTLTFGIDLIGGKYEGKLSGDGKSIAGTWTQGPTPLPLNLIRATPEIAWEIPAPPPPPKLMAPDADPSFEVATIKPNPSGNSGLQGLTLNGRNFRVRNGSVLDLIGFAYDVQAKQIANAPDWGNSDRYDIDGLPDKEGTPSPAQLRIMIRKLLVERFGLKVHEEKRDMPAFVLTEAKMGAKLSPTQLNLPLPGLGISPGEGGIRLNIANGTLDDFAGFLQMIVLDRPVVNHTELKGRYDFHVTFTPDDSQFHGHPPNMARPPAASAAASDPATPAAESAANLFEAMQQQAGLRLSPEKAAVDVVVIDHVEKPSAN